MDKAEQQPTSHPIYISHHATGAQHTTSFQFALASISGLFFAHSLNMFILKGLSIILKI